VLGLDYFGYRLAIVRSGEESGKYGELARNGTLLRVWDFDAAEADGTLWRGYARRFVNSYVPRFDASDLPDRRQVRQVAGPKRISRAKPTATRCVLPPSRRCITSPAKIAA
jgi:hypothetical protein